MFSTARLSWPQVVPHTDTVLFSMSEPEALVPPSFTVLPIWEPEQGILGFFLSLFYGGCGRVGSHKLGCSDSHNQQRCMSSLDFFFSSLLPQAEFF